MAINKCYIKYRNIYYAYEITYEWDEAQQKKVCRKRCAGHFDHVTGNSSPLGQRANAKQTEAQRGTHRKKHSLTQGKKRDWIVRAERAGRPAPSAAQALEQDPKLKVYIDSQTTFSASTSSGESY